MAERSAPRAPSKRDPYWDMEGRQARRDRRLRMIVELVAFAAGLTALWAAIFVRLYG